MLFRSKEYEGEIVRSESSIDTNTKQYPFSQFKKENIKIDVKSDIFKIKLKDVEKEVAAQNRSSNQAIGAVISNILLK